MRHLTAALLAASALALAVASACEGGRDPGAFNQANLERDEVLALSTGALQEAEIDLERYLPPDIEHDPSGYWRVTYRGKENQPGNWVGLLVNDRTRRVTIIPGE